MNNVIALVGNPNCGKTTLFNTLTGTYQKTGNWTGVTTEKKIGNYKKDKSIKIVDLPGLYSLSTHSDDEKVVLEYLKSTPPKSIINIVDGTNLERNLYLTIELIKLNIPVVLAVNMADELKKNGIKLDIDKLSKIFGVPVILISALKKTDTDKLIYVAKNLKQKPIKQLQFVDAKERYGFIEKSLKATMIRKQTKAEKFTLKADAILTHRYFGFPIFFLVITAVYFLSMKLGGTIGQQISFAFDNVSRYIETCLKNLSVREWIIGLLCNAILKGLGTVCSFLPQILILFALLTLIEQVGYASRIAFILDRLFRSFGLGGKSLIPITVACGCTVSGLLATKTIENKKEKIMTVFLAPFMPCGAKTAVYGWIAYEFFGGSALVASSMYFIGILAIAVFGSILKKLKVFKDGGGEFILEMPCLRPPAYKDVLLTLWEKSKDFLVKAGSIIFLVTVCLWLLQNFGFKGYTNGNVENSFIYLIGNGLKFIFYPLGFGNWQATVAMLSSILAKEAVVESLTMLSIEPLTLFYNKYSLYAFMVFLLLSPPCIAALSTAKRELKSSKWFIFMITFEFFSAYTLAFIINFLGFLISLDSRLILLLVLVIMLVLTAVLVIGKFVKKYKGANRHVCKKGSICQKHNTI